MVGYFGLHGIHVGPRWSSRHWNLSISSRNKGAMAILMKGVRIREIYTTCHMPQNKNLNISDNVPWHWGCWDQLPPCGLLLGSGIYVMILFSLLTLTLQAHSSVEKAGLIGLVKLRYIESDEKLSLRGDKLREAIRKDRDNGLIPFFVRKNYIKSWWKTELFKL